MGPWHARSVDDDVEWVRQAVFEVEHLRECEVDRTEDPAPASRPFETRTDGAHAVVPSMHDGGDGFGGSDLPLMTLVGSRADRISFHTLPNQLNETHRRGLEVEGDGD